MKKVIIAEKPSVAKNIADAVGAKSRKDGFIEGENYVITWAFGHLLQLYDAKDYDEKMTSWRMENFPYIPETFRYKIKMNGKSTDKGAEKQMKLIEFLIKREDVDGVISATDNDREGQIIADEISLFLHVKKPVFRLLLDEWTPPEVLKGLSHLIRNEKMKPLQDAGFGRQLADWLIGINLTSVATVKFRNDDKIGMLNVGRVLLPTLKIIYDRDKEIENFKTSKYYKLTAAFQAEGKDSFESTYYEEDNEKFEDKSALDALAEQLKDKSGVIFSKTVEKKKEYPPFLFNLTNLQGYITSKSKGFTADKVLKTAQSLYEKKLITYPRTASQALDESLKERAEKVLANHKQGLSYEEEIHFHTSRRIFDNKKVESHSAIIPTYIIPKEDALTADEKVVYTAVRNRFLMQFMPVSEVEETVLKIKMEDETVRGIFITRGKVLLVEGWKKVEKIETKETELPEMEENEKVKALELKVNEIVRKPPKPHTEKTLLRVMETCGKSRNLPAAGAEETGGGPLEEETEKEDTEEMMISILSGFSIGTPATRAETIKKLKDVGYVKAKGKSLSCTELGRMMVEAFPVKELFDLDYTGKLEKTLADIEKEKFTREDFLTLIIEFVNKAVEDVKSDPGFGAKSSAKEGETVLGKCPECGGDVVESPKAFGCSNWRNGCKFTIWKDDKYISSFGKKVTPYMVKLLLEGGRVGFHGLISKNGNKFSAYFYYEKGEDQRYRWRMEFIRT